MGWIILESFVALAVLVAIVAWTLHGRRADARDAERERAGDDPER